MLADAFKKVIAELARSDALREHFATTTVENPELKHAAYEAAVLKAVRELDGFVEAAFLAYLCGEPALDGSQKACHVHAKDQTHARGLLGARGDREYLSWESVPGTVAVADIFLSSEHPLRIAMSSHSDALANIRRVRNRVAHDSLTAQTQYAKAVGVVLTVPPSPVPAAGEFLAMRPLRGRYRGREILAAMIDDIRMVCRAIACDYGDAG